MAQDKAQHAANGHSLSKGCNTGLCHLRTSLRAQREIVICGVKSLVKGMPQFSLTWAARRAMQLTVSRCADMCSLFVTVH